MKTRQDIEHIVQAVANRFEAKLAWSREDGITWLTLFGGKIQPKIFDEVTQQLSQSTGVDFYFNKCGIDSIEFAVNANLLNAGASDFPKLYETSKIEEYGTLFK